MTNLLFTTSLFIVLVSFGMTQERTISRKMEGDCC